jgi:CRP-like cAMP-binding protein
MFKKLMSVLEQSELFAGFTEQQLDQVILHLEPKHVTLKSGERLYKRGDSAYGCWIIVSGDLAAKRASLRSPLRHMVYHIGSVTGIQGLADPGSERAISMICEKRSELIEITREGIDRLDDEAQILLWKNVARLLMRKLSLYLYQESFEDR